MKFEINKVCSHYIPKLGDSIKTPVSIPVNESASRGRLVMFNNSAVNDIKLIL